MSSHKWEVSFYDHQDDLIELTNMGISFTLRDIYLKVYLELEETKEE